MAGNFIENVKISGMDLTSNRIEQNLQSNPSIQHPSIQNESTKHPNPLNNLPFTPENPNSGEYHATPHFTSPTLVLIDNRNFTKFHFLKLSLITDKVDIKIV